MATRVEAVHGILVQKEFHATEFVAGRGRLGKEVISKYQRSRIYRDAFALLNTMDGVRVFTSCRKHGPPEWAFERMITRIHKTVETWDSHAVLIVDQGKEAEITRLIRKMGVYNPVPVYRGARTFETQNVATVRILEDPFFKELS